RNWRLLSSLDRHADAPAKEPTLRDRLHMILELGPNYDRQTLRILRQEVVLRIDLQPERGGCSLLDGERVSDNPKRVGHLQHHRVIDAARLAALLLPAFGLLLAALL